MFRSRIPFHQIAMAIGLGVAGGVYIYKPIFEPLGKNPNHSNQEGSDAQQTGEKLQVETNLNAKDD